MGDGFKGFCLRVSVQGLFTLFWNLGNLVFCFFIFPFAVGCSSEYGFHGAYCYFDLV